jgi:hypothetical protein
LKVHLHHFSNIKSHKEVTKQQESRFFLLFLLDDREAKKHTDPTDLDPQHYEVPLILFRVGKGANFARM